MTTMRATIFIWLCCVVFVVCVDYVSSNGKSEQQYCPYFQNREPRTQKTLKNCTWYKDNSCCSEAELEFAFSQLSSLPGADEKCQSYLDYLYCYICAPNQNSFFSTNTLTVCEEFCEDVYLACSDAVLKGRRIEQLYSSGKEFCKSRRFKVDKEANGKCFTYGGDHSGTNGKAQRLQADLHSFLQITLFTLLLVP